MSKDLEKIISIILNEIKNALKRDQRVELRSAGLIFYTKTQKASIRRNPRTQEKVNVLQKRNIMFKMSKDLFKKINNEK